jgi:hypothetical protein
MGVYYLPPLALPRSTYLSISMHAVSRLSVWPYQRPALHPLLPPALMCPKEDAFAVSHLVKLFSYI